MTYYPSPGGKVQKKLDLTASLGAVIGELRRLGYKKSTIHSYERICADIIRYADEQHRTEYTIAFLLSSLFQTATRLLVGESRWRANVRATKAFGGTGFVQPFRPDHPRHEIARSGQGQLARLSPRVTYGHSNSKYVGLVSGRHAVAFDREGNVAK